MEKIYKPTNRTLSLGGNLKKNFPYLKWKNILFMPLFLLLIASMTTTTVRAQNPMLFIDPPTATIDAVGQKVTITVNVTQVTNVGGFDIRINYNQSILSYTKNNYTVDGPGQLFPPLGTGTRNFFDNSGTGYVYLSLTMGYPTVMSGSGRVVWITFGGLMEGVSNLTFNPTFTKIFDSDGNPITQDPPGDGQITVIPEFPAAIATLLLLTTTLTATLLGKTVWSKKHRTKNETN